MTILHINSRYRSTGDYGDFWVQIPQAGTCYSSVKLLDVCVPRSAYVFDSSNNVLVFYEAATPNLTATITPGSYSASDLCTELGARMTAASAALGNTQTYTVTYSTTANTLTITSTAGFVMRLDYVGSPWYELGFPSIQTGSSISHTSTNAVCLNPPSYLYLSIEGLGLSPVAHSGTQVTAGHFPLLLSGNSYTVAPWGAGVDYDITLPSTVSRSGSLRVRLTDSEGRVAALRGDWAFTLLLSDAAGRCRCLSSRH